MDELDVRQLVSDIGTGACSADEAVARLRRLPFTELGYAKVDHHRPLRQGLAEAVYGPGKTPAQCAGIVAELLAGGSSPVLLTRSSPSQANAALERNPGGTRVPTETHAEDSASVATSSGRLSTLYWRPSPSRPGRVVVCSAGTADEPARDECVATLRAYGFVPDILADCGVAGVHRVLASFDALAEADAVVVIAGMEGALASLVGGLTAAPVVAVPTSAGYGAALEGVTALLAMHASCAAGITVVGIDNGFGAACAVARILR
jgi:pyridinium-3,5-biscarboxylic acid mononucleotide synthase